MSNEKLYTKGNLCSLITFAIIVRWSVSLHPYSGQNSPPMFGDYEAQRHWMEVTVNLSPKEWYLNTSNNDLMYWGLDYPPLTAYHSYVNGKIAQLIDPDFVKLHSSRGYESYDHKFFMRTTVIIPDIIIYFSSVILFFNRLFKNNQKCVDLKYGEITDVTEQQTISFQTLNTSLSCLSLVAISLLYPGLILIDHGHFQYNSVSLGFTVAAITALLYGNLLMSSFFFCLSLNYKQMSLYHSLPFFVYMLSNCFRYKKFNKLINFKMLLCISLTVILTFGVIWFPFLSSNDIFFHVIQRLFPLSRGIFEDKVSNVWCVINVVYKLQKTFSQAQMAKICIICVLLTSLVSLVNLFKKPTIFKFLLSLINVSLSFFLFSYQVHEKSILLVVLPVLLFFPFDPLPCFWFLIISNFSMLPLFLKDDLLLPFISLTLLFTFFVFANINFQTISEKKSNNNLNDFFFRKNTVLFAFKLSTFGCIIIFLFSILIKPPSRYPDLWPLLSSVYSCLHFCLFYIYFNYAQMFEAQN